jgi:ppGpp synthetase/RelA/SpoT-type nucleotidyltranferase
METMPVAAFREIPLDLASFDAFGKHPWVASLGQRYSHDATLAGYAIIRLIQDLQELNAASTHDEGRVLFTAVEGRVKSEESFFRKLYGTCIEQGPRSGITQTTLRRLYEDIRDLGGVRFSCPYYDEIVPTIKGRVLPRLNELGYATNHRDSDLADKDYLDAGNALGYRSYHFFVKIPTPIDIYGQVVQCLCEVQARSELQHVWAVKSHDLLYKSNDPSTLSDDHVMEDMRQISNSLRAMDQFLVGIRDRAHRTGSRQ